MEDYVNKLYDVLLDNHNSPKDKLISELEAAIAKLKPYNHNEENIRIACGIDMKEKDTSAISGKGIDKISQEIEILEKVFTKREAIFMLVGIQEQMKEFHKMGNLGKLKGLMDDED